MPIFMKINANYNEESINGVRGKAYHEQTMHQLLELLNAADANACANQFIELMNQVGLASDFSAFGINNKHQFQALVNSVNLERMQNNPVKISPDKLLAELTSEMCND
jgi:alcohol dehydrogenase class IV